MMAEQPAAAVAEPALVLERVRVEVEDHVALVTLTRPDKHNALDLAMFEAIIVFHWLALRVRYHGTGFSATVAVVIVVLP